MVVVVLNNRYDEATPDQIQYVFTLKSAVEQFILMKGDRFSELLSSFLSNNSLCDDEQIIEGIVNCGDDRDISVERILDTASSLERFGKYSIALSLLAWFSYSNREPEATQAQLSRLMFLRSRLLDILI